jgi:hypothetical protein
MVMLTSSGFWLIWSCRMNYSCLIFFFFEKKQMSFAFHFIEEDIVNDTILLRGTTYNLLLWHRFPSNWGNSRPTLYQLHLLVTITPMEIFWSPHSILHEIFFFLITIRYSWFLYWYSLPKENILVLDKVNRNQRCKMRLYVTSCKLSLCTA